MLPLPDPLGGFTRTHLESLTPESGRLGTAAAYVAASFSAVIATWRPADPNVRFSDGVGVDVMRQFKADVVDITTAEATSSPVVATTLLASSRVRVPTLEARYLIDGVGGTPGYATLAGFGLHGWYVSIATTLAGPDIWRTCHRSAFHAALASAWETELASSAVALPIGLLMRALGSLPREARTDLQEWQELVRGR